MGNNQLNTGVKKGENNTPGIMSLVISIIAVIGCWIPGLNIISMFLNTIYHIQNKKSSEKSIFLNIFS